MDKKNKIDINALEKSIKSRFGRKMPSNGNLEEELTREQLLISRMIMGSLGALIWGKQSINRESQIKTLLGDKNHIFSLVKSIKEYSDTVINKEKKYVNVNLTEESVNTLKTNLSNPIVTAIENLPNRFEELIKKSSKPSVETSAVKPLTVDKNSNEFIDALTKFVKISKGTKFDELNKLLSGNDFKQFILHVKNLGNELSDPKIINSINSLHNFIETIINIGSIEAASLIKSEYILSYISGKYFIKLKRVLDRVNELNEYSNKININDKLIALQGIIELIPNIGALRLKDLLWSRISMNYLEYFVKDKITFILDTLETTLKKYSNLDESTEKLSKCIHSILDIFSLDSKKIEDDKEVLSLISSLISNELNNIVKIIQKYDNRTLESVIKKINNINGLIININSLQNSLPSIISIIKSYIKLSLIQEELNCINQIINSKLNNSNTIQSFIDNINDNLKLFLNLIQILNIINNNLDNINFKNTLKLLFNVQGELIVVNNLFKKLKNLNEKSKTPLTFEGLNTTFSNFSEILDSLILYDDTLDRISAIASTVDAFAMLIQHLDTKLLNSKDTAELNVVFTDIANIINNHFVQGTPLNQALRSLSNIDIKNDTYDKIEMISKVIKEIALLSNLKILSTVSITSLDPIINITDKLVVVIEKFKTVKEDDIKKADNLLKSFMKVVIGSAAILIFGSLIMSYIDPISFLSFTLALVTFVGGILWVYSKISKDQLESAFSSAEDLGVLIGLSGAVLVMGSLFMKHINIEELLGFTAALGLFIGGILYVYSLFSDKLKETFTSAFELGLLIAISGGTLILGSLLFHLINWQDLWGFAAALGVFMFGMLSIYSLFSKSFKHAIQGAKEFTILITVSAGLLVLGGLIGEWVIENWSNIWRFGLALAAFTIMIGVPWILGSLWFKNALKGAKEFAILITVSAAVMILGPLLMESAYNGDLLKAWLSTIGFAALLSAFVIGVGFALYLANKNSKSSIMGALSLGLAVGISAAALVLGPAYLIEHNISWGNVLLFAVGLGVFIYAMTKLLDFAGKKLFDILKGGLAVAIIGVLTYGAAWVISQFYNAIKGLKFNVLLKGIAKMGVVFGAFTALIAGLGVLVTGPQAIVLGAGAAALAVLEGLVWGAAKVVNAIAISMINLNKAAKLFEEKDENGNPKNVQNILEMINAFGNILKLLTNKISRKTAGKLAKIMPGTILGIRSLSLIGNVVKDWANMWVPDIDSKTGKTKGYRKLDNSDITNAINNIKTVLTAIGTAIRDVVGDPKNKDIFGEGFFGGKSPFEVAMKSFKYSGNILSGIAKGIKDWSSMIIPLEYDSKGNVIRYTTLNDKTLDLAQNKIQSVLSAIGRAIAEVVNDPKNKNIFALGQNSPAMIASKSIKETSSALNNIVNIIKTFSGKDFKDIIKNLDDKDNGPLSNIKKILGGIIDIVNLFLSPIKDSRGTIAKWFVGEKTFAENLNDNKDEIQKSVESIKVFSESINKIFTIVSNMSKSSQENKDAINLITNKNNVINKIGELIKLFDSVSSNIAYNNMRHIYNVAKNSKQFTDSINKTYDVINNILTKLLNLYSLNNRVNNISFDNITLSINKFINTIEDINKSINNIALISNSKTIIERLVENTDQLIGLLNNFVKLIKLSKTVNSESYDDLKNGILSLYNTVLSIKIDTTIFLNFSSFINLLEYYVKLINSIDLNIFDDNVNSLKDGILNINGIIKQIDTNKTFAQHVETLKKYIETINGVELDKLNRMQNFVDSMNRLSQNLGNLDNLTDAIANRLSSVLFELVNQLTQADKSISNAHKLQDERKKLIEESVSKIENLMSQHMIVEISQMTDEEKKQQSPQTPNGSIDGTPVNSSAAQGDDTTVQSNGNKLESPDTAQATTAPGLSQNANGLTYWQFRSYMEQEFLKKFKGDLKNDITGQ